jgi:acyl-CoA thioester hydrolase
MTDTSQPEGPALDRFFRVNIRVHFADTDAAGVVWFANFFRFFEEAEDELFRALGRTRMEILRELGVMMPRVDASCRFRSPAHAEEVLEIGIAVESLTERRITYRFQARERDSRRLVAEGTYRVACVDADFTSMEFPPAFRALFDHLDDVLRQQALGATGSGRHAGWA